MKDHTFTKLPRDVFDSSAGACKTGGASEEANATKSFLESRLRKADIVTLTEELDKVSTLEECQRYEFSDNYLTLL
ncbi:hypothetical protein GE061_018645 [Apolygus lucorum]|uniref:Uncharacterized protein n=1 Tax=Apolygus lucorum TaxID=248454 RepID=A0A8S9XEL3_APOLU|nr:hypothetical protein GE061_018645 [Apolygus lucorum]